MADASNAAHPSFLEGQRLLRRAVNAPIRAALAHWLGLHDRERLPERERFDPTGLPSRTLPNLFLMERADDGPWRLRLMGTHLVAALGQDFTGCDLVDGQVPGISRSRTMRLLGPMTETGLPAHFHGRSAYRYSETYDDHEQILLPFRRHDSNSVDVVLGAIVYEGLRTVFGPGTIW